MPVPGGQISSRFLCTGAVNTRVLSDNAVDSSKIADGAIDGINLFDNGLRPVQIVASLPGTADEGDVAYLIGDNKLYRYDGGAWILAVDGADITDGTIVASDKIQANTITSDEIAANTIVAGNIQAGAISTTELDANAVTAAKVAAFNMEVGKYIRSTTYTPGSAGWSIDADGSAEFQNVTVRGSLNADDIDAGTLAVARIGSNDITMNKIELNAHLVSGQELRSTSYTAGSSGWIIDADGSAEFNDVTVRGTLSANDVDGNLTMISGGKIRTAASGERIELAYTAGNLPAITFHDSSGNSDAYIQYLNGISMTVGTNDNKPLNIDAAGQLNLQAGTGDEVVIAPNAGTTAVAISSSRARFYDPIYGADGSAGAPMFTFNSDTNTGMYRQGEGIIGFSINSTTRLSITSTGADVSGKVYGMDNGSVTAPSLYWGSDSNTGLWRITENYLGLAAGAVTLMQWGYTGSNRELYMYGLPSMSNNYVRWNSSNNLVGYSSSTLRIKKDVRDAPVGLTDHLRPSVFRYRRDDEIDDGQREDETRQYFHVAEDEWDTEHIGLIAEWTAEVDDRLGIYQDDDPDPVNYEVESVLALAIADLQDARGRIQILESKMARLS